MKNILVTGGAGFVGTNLIKLLIDSDADLHVVDADQQNALDLARKLDWDQTIIELLESKHYSQSNHKTM